MNRILLILLIVLVALDLEAQEKLQPITAPTSPASAVLGIQPSAILTPKSYRALETALYSSLVGKGGDGLVPEDFALEFTPYWFTDHSLALEEYLYPRTFWQQVRMSSSFSLASTQNLLLGDSTATNGIAFGYRNRFYFSNESDRTKIQNFRNTLGKFDIAETGFKAEIGSLVENDPSIKTIQDFWLSSKPIFQNFLKVRFSISQEKAKIVQEKVYSRMDDLPDFDRSDKQKLVNFYNAYYALLNEELKEVAHTELVYNQFKNYLKERQGLTIDIAYAGFLYFPSNNFEHSVMPRHSVWLTPVCTFADKYQLKVIGTLRYEWSDIGYYKKYYPESNIFKNNIDFGLAVNGEYNAFYWQAEAIGRHSRTEKPAGTDADGNNLFRKDSSSDFQYIGKIGYRLSKDVAITFSFGKQFKPIVESNSTLVSLLSLNFGFGTPTTDDLK